MDVSFMTVLIACLVPVVIAVLAVVADENDAQHGGWHKKHI
jgi:hypothetical protein